MNLFIQIAQRITRPAFLLPVRLLQTLTYIANEKCRNTKKKLWKLLYDRLKNRLETNEMLLFVLLLSYFQSFACHLKILNGLL